MARPLKLDIRNPITASERFMLYFRRVFSTLLFSWVSGTVATAPDCKSGTHETSEVRVLSCPLYVPLVELEDTSDLSPDG